MTQDINKPPPPAPDEPKEPILRWLGRQVAYVKEALETDAQGNPLPKKAPPADAKAAAADAIYRKTHVEEQPLPQNPLLKLRRTVIDEVIPEKPASQDGSDKPPAPG